MDVENLVEPSEEIREHCRSMAEFAPDVESGDEDEEDVFQGLLEMFRQHGRSVLTKYLGAEGSPTRNEKLPGMTPTPSPSPVPIDHFDLG